MTKTSDARYMKWLNHFNPRTGEVYTEVFTINPVTGERTLVETLSSSTEKFLEDAQDVIDTYEKILAWRKGLANGENVVNLPVKKPG